MGCSMPGFFVIQNHSEFAQTHVHSVGDAIHPFHSSPSLFNLFQHQGLFFASYGKLSASASVEYASRKCIYRNLLAPRADPLSYMLSRCTCPHAFPACSFHTYTPPLHRQLPRPPWLSLCYSCSCSSPPCSALQGVFLTERLNPTPLQIQVFNASSSHMTSLSCDFHFSLGT